MKKRAGTTYLDEADRLVNEEKDTFLERRYPASPPVPHRPRPKHYCAKCRMTFHIRKSFAGNEMFRCPENGCKVRFWTGTTDHSSATVGIDPDDAKRLQTVGGMTA